MAEDRPAQSLFELLVADARALTEALNASGCAFSRAIGDVLVLVAEHTVDGRTIAFGQGYLVSDYPQTQAVLSERRPLALSLDEPDVDEREAELLRELGYASLLMLPLELDGEVWGLVEVYGEAGRRFSAADAELAGELLARTRDALARLRR